MNYENNPLNIRYKESNHWQGQIAPFKGFCQFRSIYYGLRAAALIIARYRAHGVVTIEKIVSRWAPPCDNNPTENYINYVVLMMNKYREEEGLPFPDSSPNVIERTSTINEPIELEWLLRAMSMFETGTKIERDESVWSLLYPNVFENIFCKINK